MLKFTLFILYFPSRKIYQTPIKKFAVKYHKWTFEKDRALIEFISIIKIDPKYQYGTMEHMLENGHSLTH
jgi:hypothetical protein